MSEHCKCPAVGGRATIAPTGCCDRCGTVGSKREEAIRSALASGRYQLAREIGRHEGRKQGYERGLQVGRLETIEALAEREVERDPKQYEPHYEMELQ